VREILAFLQTWKGTAAGAALPPGFVQAHRFGWLRRSECDTIIGAVCFEAWERPNGGIVRIPRQERDKPIEMIVAVRKRGAVFVISPKGTAQATSPSRFRL
jgi:hypothetical protein